MILGQLKKGEHQVNYWVLSIVIILSPVKQLISETADDYCCFYPLIRFYSAQSAPNSHWKYKMQKTIFWPLFSCEPDIWWTPKQVTATRCIEPPLWIIQNNTNIFSLDIFTRCTPLNNPKYFQQFRKNVRFLPTTVRWPNGAGEITPLWWHFDIKEGQLRPI